MRRQIQTLSAEALLASPDDYDTLIDARSESEYAFDHIPGAINHPVLNDRQRASVGTLYQRVDPFVARKHGAQFANLNIAAHLAGWMDHDRDWRPVVYCWRGGQRSGSLALVLHEIGWPVRILQGGYKAYRRHLQATFSAVIDALQFRVLTGPTGSGKTELLTQMAHEGFQTLDLEALAHHRGSLLGGYTTPQPSQKWFESQVYAQLSAMDPARPVWVESESSKIGQLHLPERLFQRMLCAPALALEAPVTARAVFLQQIYQDMLADPDRLRTAITALQFRQPKRLVQQWLEWVEMAQWQSLAESLLVAHYDPAYRRSQHRLGVCGAIEVMPGQLTWALIKRLEAFESETPETTSTLHAFSSH